METESLNQHGKKSGQCHIFLLRFRPASPITRADISGAHHRTCPNQDAPLKEDAKWLEVVSRLPTLCRKLESLQCINSRLPSTLHSRTWSSAASNSNP